MDPLSALAIAAAVLQFVDFGGKLLSRTWDTYRVARHAAEENEEISKVARQLSELSAGVRASTQSWLRTGDAVAVTAETQLHQLCEEIDSITTELQSIMEKIKRRKTVRKDPERKMITRFPLAGMWDARKISDMSERLEELNRRVMTAILFGLW